MTLYLERHWIANLIKNYQINTLISIFPKFLGLKALKALWLMRHGTSTEEKLAVIRAFLWNLKNLKSTLKKRAKIQLLRKVSDKEICEKMYKESFELQLWLKRKKHPITQFLTRGQYD